MLTDWINVTSVNIQGADRLYPKGIDWKIVPGINAIIGGTGLGKTTLIYAIQFAIFGKVVVDASERIEREFFKDRLTKRSAEDVKSSPPTVRVEFVVGSSQFSVTRLLTSGALHEVIFNGSKLRPSQYEITLAERVGLKGDFAGLVRLQSYLFFFGESRHLLAWDNQLQHELINLLLSDHAVYQRLGELWDAVESADSSARNLSSQAVRMERDLKELKKAESKVAKLQKRSDAGELAEQLRARKENVSNLQASIAEERKWEIELSSKIERAHYEFHKRLSEFESAQSSDIDDELLAAALADPNVASVRRSLEQFYKTPDARSCPCCGRKGISKIVTQLAREAAASARDGNCIVCSKTLPQPHVRTVKLRQHTPNTDSQAASLKTLLFQREQVRSRIGELLTLESRALQELSDARAESLDFAEQNPTSAVEVMQITIDQMRDRERAAKKVRDRELLKLKRELAKTNVIFGKISRQIAKAFKKYASLYLDEPCDVEFLSESELPVKRGPQVKAPHAAFFPVVSGEARPSAQALSDAQRSFIDLAFRMAVIEVWHQRTGKTVTMIIETPEGAVDIAYMDRVATMMRTFGDQKHTMLITTNLNNAIFLPHLMARWPNKDRRAHILNLLSEGRPRQVQIDHIPHFNGILKSLDTIPQVS